MPTPLRIEKLVYGGDGLARTLPDTKGRRMAVFVPFTLPGETVETGDLSIRRGMARAELVSVLEASLERQPAPCPYFGTCGGCHLQHGSYKLQLACKQAILQETLDRARLDISVPINTLSAEPWQYRNRIRLHVRTAPTWQAGYLERGSHRLLHVAECPIAAPLLQSTFAALADPHVATLAPASLQEIELFCNHDSSQMTLHAVVANSAPQLHAEFDRWTNALQNAIPQMVGAVATTRTADNPEPKVVASSAAHSLLYKVGDHRYQVSAGSFFQVNLHLLDQLAALVTAPLLLELAGHESANVCDVYAGVGLFSLPLAAAGLQVIAVEAGRASSTDLARNLLPYPHAKSVRSTTEQFLARAKQRPDAIVLDPPRAGLGPEVTQQLVRIGAPMLAYLSCDPTTLARDLHVLLGAGYRVQQLTLIDLFPQTFHMETFVLLRRG